MKIFDSKKTVHFQEAVKSMIFGVKGFLCNTVTMANCGIKST